jgi:hypothetical protein
VKTAVSLLALVLALTATSAASSPFEASGLPSTGVTEEPAPARAAAQSTPPKRELLVPPPEYDYPYKGELVVRHVSQKEVREACPSAKYTLGVALGCAHRWPTSCHIILAPEADMKAAGYPPELVLRHEIAHCNGWPGDHPGARPFWDWADISSDPVMNAAALFDKLALGAVGKTVANVMAAKDIGLAPESKLTAEVLTDPATAGPLARAAGIGTDLSDDQWQEAHDIAVRTSRARRAEKAAASQSVPNRGQAAPQPQQAQPTAARATTDVVCAVVLNTPDGFLAVRERPGTQFRMTDKLRPGQAVNISSEDCVWHSNGKATCNKWIMVSGSDRTPASGWVRSKYLQPYPEC